MSTTVYTYTSFDQEGGQWAPRVNEQFHFQDNEVVERIHIWDELFDSKEEADEFARTELAKG